MAEHHHHGHSDTHRTLGRAAIITVVFALAEAIGGWWTGSLALVSDAGHMFSDAGALLLGALAAWMARQPPSQRHSYGLGRAEVVAALVNATVMLAIVAAIAYEAVIRFRHPGAVNGVAAALIATAGLAVNLWVLRRLAPHRHDLNTRAARLHVLGDVLGSVAALISGVLSVHDLHVWTLSGSRTALSAHVVVRSLGEWDRMLGDLQLRLHQAFDIDHVTLQPESGVRPLVRH